MPARLSRIVATIAALVISTSCGTPPSPDEPPRRVMILADNSVPDAREIVSPAVLAADLGLRRGGLEVVLVDTGGDPDVAAAAARAATADPRVVGVIVAPFVSVGSRAHRILSEGGLATVTLSQVDEAVAGSRGNRRMVPTIDDAAAVLTEVAGPGACLLAGQDPWARRIADELEASSTATGWRRPASVVGCAVVVWSGSAAEGLAPRGDVDGLLVVTDQSKTPGFADATGSAAAPTMSVCGCVDPFSVATPALQSFAHAYQEETGLDPGPYAAEAYDAASLLASLADEAAGREAIADLLASVRVYDGAAGRYVWDSSSVLTSPGPRTYRATGVRWLAL